MRKTNLKFLTTKKKVISAIRQTTQNQKKKEVSFGSFSKKKTLTHLPIFASKSSTPAQP
jgi:hypothetical protein